MASLLVGGGGVILRRDLGSSGPVQNLLAGQAAVYGAKLSTGISGIVVMQAGGAAAQLILTTGIIYNVSVLEAIAVLDGFSSTAIFSTTTTDGIVATDPFGGLTTINRTITDTVAGLDNLNRSVLFNLTTSDSLTGSDNLDSTVDTPGVVTGLLSDSVGASDAITVQWTSNASVTGSITALDAGSAGGTASGSVISVVTAGGAFNGYLSSGVVFDVDAFDSVFATDELTVEYFSGEDNNLKLTLAPILALYRSAERLNSNFEAIQEAFQNTLSRDGTEPNNMLVDLDMDSNRIINLGAPIDDNDAVRLIDLQNFSGGTGGGTISLPTNLSFSRNSSSVTVLSDTGTDATLPSADLTNAGVMSAADKAKLDSIEAGATGDMSGSEIVNAINTALGSVTWQGGGGSGGSTNLTFSRTATTVTVLSDTGADAVLPAADSTNAGVMSAADKTKLDGVEANATADMTGSEIVSAINTALGSSTWQSGGGGGATNLTFTRDISSVTVLSDTGTDAVIPEATNLLAGVFSGTNKAKLDGIESNATSNAPNFVKVFGGVGDNATSNNTQFTNAEASAFDVIYLPEGNFVTTLTRESFLKKYVGPGKIIMNAYGRKGYQGLSAYATEVSATASSGEYGTNENMRFSDFDYRITQPGTRRNFERYLVSGGAPAGYPKYFWAPATPKFSVFQNRGGWSGTSGILQNAVSAGATTAVLKGDVNDWSARGLVGQQVGFVSASSFDGVPGDIVTVTGASGSTITFTPALTNSYPANDIVSHGYRTMNTHELKIVDHTGGGDAYAYCARISVAYPTLASQQDTFHAATGGIIGGDITLGANGNYATGWECAYWDNGNDGAIIGSVNSYVRQNNTASRANSVWLHDFPKMDGGGTSYEAYGLKPLDGVWVAGVAARTGLDLTRSRFSVAAVALPLGERIGFDCEMPVTPGPSNGWGYVADKTNNMFMRGGSDGGGKFIQLRNQDNYVYIRPTSNQFTANTDFGAYTVSMGRLNILNSSGSTTIGSIYAGSDGSGDFVDFFQGSTYRMRLRGSNGTLNFNGNINAAGDLAAGAAVRGPSGFFINTSVYIFWDGSNLRATKNGGVSSTIIV